jgi:hypothetical protein
MADLCDLLWPIALLVFIVLALIGLVALVSRHKCPRCGIAIEPDDMACPVCKAPIPWE